MARMLLRSSPFLLALGALLAPPGCSRRDEEGPIRLVDLAAGAAIDSAADLAAGGDAFLEGARIVASGPLASFDPSARARHDGAWIAARLLEQDAAGAAVPRLDLVQVPVEPERPVLVRVDGARGLNPGERLFVLELASALAAEQLADRARVEAVLAGSAGFLRDLAPAPGAAGGAARHETVLVATPAARAFLIGRASSAPDEPAGALLVAELCARGAWLKASALPGRSPWVRTVSAGCLAYESLVLGAPGSARFRVRVPARRPRLTAAATPLFPEKGQTFAAEVKAEGKGGGPRTLLSTTLHADAWTPLELDLSSLAGEEAEITLSVGARAGAGAPPLVAFGAPVIDGACDDPRPDVILISLDTARADRMSLYGCSRETTPRLELLAEGAAVFENAIAPAPWTLPSHVSLFSGQYPDRHGVHASLSQVGADTPWLAETFRAAGYRTAAFTGGGYVHPEFGFARGFERYGFADPATPPVEWAEGRGGNALDLQAAEDAAHARAELLDLIRGERRGARFLFVHSYAAHSYAATPDDLMHLGAERSQIDDLLLGMDTTKLNKFLETPAPPDVLLRVQWRTRLLYDASLRVADRLVADVAAALESAGRLDHTILVVLSDHGEELLERGTVGHGQSLFEEMVRVPLLVRGPGIEPARCADVVSLADLAPTLRALCGLEAPAAEAAPQDGRSLAALLAGETLPPAPAYSRGDRRARVFRCVRGAKLKYVFEEAPGEAARARLFVLADDPGELQDAASARPAEARLLEAALRARVAEMQRHGSAGPSARLSPEVEKELRALGYLGGQ